MEGEKYQPTPEEIQKAEETMTEEQKIRSEARAEGFGLGKRDEEVKQWESKEGKMKRKVAASFAEDALIHDSIHIRNSGHRQVDALLSESKEISEKLGIPNKKEYTDLVRRAIDSILWNSGGSRSTEEKIDQARKYADEYPSLKEYAEEKITALLRSREEKKSE